MAFGAVRVFDVDGQRVDKGKIETGIGAPGVVVPASLPGGTYTVTWRVVSTDGHRISGGFQFYVGSPSTISAVAVARRRRRRAVGWGYGAVRFTWYAALLAVIGLVVVRRFVWTPALRRPGWPDPRPPPGSGAASTGPCPGPGPSAPGVGSCRWCSRPRRSPGWAWPIRPGRACWPTCSGPASAGPGWPGSASPCWPGWRSPGSPGGAASSGPGPRPGCPILAAGAVGLALAAGQHRPRPHGRQPALGVPSAAVHLLAVSTWVGGLAALVVLGASAWSAVAREDRNALVRAVVTRFSRLALVAVAVLVATGTLNSFLDLAAVSDLWDTTYGRVLSTKIVLLAVALAFGAWHLRVTPRRLAGGGPTGAASRAFRRSSAVELVVLAAVVAFASALVALVPGRSLR